MKLYYVPGACSIAPHIAAREANLPVTLNKVAFGPERKTEDGRDYYTVNPVGAVPALELDNGQVLTEVAVILRYFSEQKGGEALKPQSSDEMANWRYLETLNFIATELHKSFGALFSKAVPEDKQGPVLDRIKQRFGILEKRMGSNEYVAGPKFTAADAYAFVPLFWSTRFNLDLGAGLNAYFARLKARPSVQTALSEEGLPTG